VYQLELGLKSINCPLENVLKLALGGTAVGTGLNAPKGFDVLAAKKIAEITGYPFVTSPNKFAALAAHCPVVETSGALKNIAVSIMKIANDTRFLGSGPRCGIGEINLPANEPGSSIMPGKVNPTQNEAISMVCCQVVGNDTAVNIAGMQGHFQLNVFKPVMIHNLLESATLLGNACVSFCDNCVVGITPNLPNIKKHLENSLILISVMKIQQKLLKKPIPKEQPLKKLLLNPGC